MKQIPDGSVDMILTDPPYGTTDCKWDIVIPLEPMWEQIWRILKPSGACLLFGSEPFSSALRMSQIKKFKYDWIWHKDKGANIGTSRKMPLKIHEIISVFYSKPPFYDYKGNPLNKKIVRVLPNKSGESSNLSSNNLKNDGSRKKTEYTHETKKSIFYAARDGQFGKRFHPTQKPISLLEFLIKTYTLEGETVLDFTMGSGSTGVACVNINRKFIGIEKELKYFEVAQKRISGCKE
jgi:DNA modification methylase